MILSTSDEHDAIKFNGVFVLTIHFALIKWNAAILLILSLFFRVDCGKMYFRKAKSVYA